MNNITARIKEELEKQFWQRWGLYEAVSNYPPTSAMQFVGGNVFFEQIGDKPILDFFLESKIGDEFTPLNSDKRYRRTK